eukprot:m.705087 g.705087  ORF g.705087 m.705087 type:complete len:1175 (+) comp22924_c0_seq1:142-3666(+)
MMLLLLTIATSVALAAAGTTNISMPELSTIHTIVPNGVVIATASGTELLSMFDDDDMGATQYLTPIRHVKNIIDVTCDDDPASFDADSSLYVLAVNTAGHGIVRRVDYDIDTGKITEGDTLWESAKLITSTMSVSKLRVTQDRVVFSIVDTTSPHQMRLFEVVRSKDHTGSSPPPDGVLVSAAAAADELSDFSTVQATDSPTAPTTVAMPHTPTWSDDKYPELPVAVSEIAAAVTKAAYTPFVYGRAADGEGHFFTMENNEWVPLTPPPHASDHHAMVLVRDAYVVLLGGFFTHASTKCPVPPKCRAPVQIYTIATGMWEMGAPIPWAAEGSIAATVIHDTVYACGGVKLGASNPRDCAAYNVSNNSWKTIRKMRKGVNHQAVGTDGDRMYVFGGRRTTDNVATMPSAKVQIYDPATDTWVFTRKMDIKRSGMGSAPYIHGNFYVLGGEAALHLQDTEATSDGVFPQVLVYNVATRRWSTGPAMPQGLHSIFPLARVDKDGFNEILVAGGCQASGSKAYSKRVYTLTLYSTPTTRTTAATRTVPRIGPTSTVQPSDATGTRPPEPKQPTTELRTTSRVDLPATGTHNGTASMSLTTTEAINASTTMAQDTVHVNTSADASVANTTEPDDDVMSPQVQGGHRFEFKWTYAPGSLPRQLREAQGVAFGTSLFVFGGFQEPFWHVMSKRVYEYDTITESFSKRAPIPLSTGRGISHCGQAVDDVRGRIYLVGGMELLEGKNWPNAVSVSTVYAYIPGTDTWESLPDLPAARAAGAAVVNGDQLHYFGGGTFEEEKYFTEDHADHWVLDLAAFHTHRDTVWRPLAPLSTARNHVGACVVRGMIYVFGGQHLERERDSNFNIVEVYDEFDDVWTQLPLMPTGLGHITPSVTAYGSYVAIVGGRVNDGSPYSPGLWLYDTVSRTWSVEQAPPSVSPSQVVGAINGRLVVQDADRVMIATPTEGKYPDVYVQALTASDHAPEDAPENPKKVQTAGVALLSVGTGLVVLIVVVVVAVFHGVKTLRKQREQADTYEWNSCNANTSTGSTGSSWPDFIDDEHKLDYVQDRVDDVAIVADNVSKKQNNSDEAVALWENLLTQHYDGLFEDEANSDEEESHTRPSRLAVNHETNVTPAMVCFSPMELEEGTLEPSVPTEGRGDDDVTVGSTSTTPNNDSESPVVGT